MNTPLIETRNLKKYFKTPKGMLHAVDGVDLAIAGGTTLGVVGESGCGKSTLGRTILRLIDPTSGEILYNGSDIATLSEKKLVHLRREMQIIFQDPFSSLNPRMSVRDIIAEPIRVCKLCAASADLSKRVEQLMDTVGLARRFENAYPHELDGGRRQRIGIARALSLNPEFIVCDEPVSALDVSIQAQILNLMQDLQDELGLTYMFITHNMSVVKHISNNIMIMYLGNMVEFADAQEIFKNRLHPYTKALLAAVPIPAIIEGRKRQLLTGEITSPINPKPGCRFASRCPYATAPCHEVDPTLAEVMPGHFVACHNVKEINQL